MTKEKYEFVINRIFGGNSGFLEKQDQGSPDQGSPDQGSPDQGSPDLWIKDQFKMNQID